MSAMKLQKLVYYSQAWHLVWDEEALFADHIEAWANGPVVPKLYQVHRGQFNVGTRSHGDSSKLTLSQKGSIDAVLKFYGDKSGEIEPGAKVVAWSLGAMQALEMAGTVEFESLTLVGASGQFVRRAAPTLCQEHLIADLIAISASLDTLMGDSDR
jgi:hypothetical protein